MQGVNGIAYVLTHIGAMLAIAKEWVHSNRAVMIKPPAMPFPTRSAPAG